MFDSTFNGPELLALVAVGLLVVFIAYALRRGRSPEPEIIEDREAWGPPAPAFDFNLDSGEVAERERRERQDRETCSGWLRELTGVR